MALDDRQQQITAGQGLQESRLNEEFIGWLKKWGDKILLAVLVVALLYVGWVKLKEMRSNRLDKAFEALNAALLAGDPDGLLKVADDHAGRQAVPYLAKMEAARILLESARKGTAVGADSLNPKPEDTLTPEQIRSTLQNADSLFAEVVRDNESQNSRVLLTQRARLGLAATAISLGEFDRATEVLNQVAQTAQQNHFADQEAEANRQLANIDRYRRPVEILAKADLPVSAQRTGSAVPLNPFGLGGDFELPEGVTIDEVPDISLDDFGAPPATDGEAPSGDVEPTTPGDAPVPADEGTSAADAPASDDAAPAPTPATP